MLGDKKHKLNERDIEGIFKLITHLEDRHKHDTIKDIQDIIDLNDNDELI